MAPKGTKRASTGGIEKAEKALKKAAVGKCSEIAKALGNLESLPESCRTMLVSMAEPALSTYAAERHPFQAQGVEMVGKTLAMIEADLASSISQEEAKVSGSDAEQAKRTAAFSAAKAKLTELEQAVTAAKETIEADTSAEKAAKADVAIAKDSLTEKEHELANSMTKKMSLEIARTVYDPLKTSKLVGPDGKKSLHTIQKVLKDFELEELLVSSIGEACGKEVEERGTFDGIVVKHIDEKISEWTAANEASIKAGEALKAELTNAQTVAEQQHTALAEKLSASKAALQTALAAVSEGKTAFKEAEAAVKSFEKDMTAAGKKLEQVKVELEAFKDGPMKAFVELKDFAAPQMPEPVPEEEAAPTPQETAEFQPVD